MRVLLKFILFIICFITATLTNINAAELGIIQNIPSMNNSAIAILDETEDYHLIANNNNYEISVARKEANNDYNDDKNNSISYFSTLNIYLFVKSSPNDFGKDYKISSYLKNIVCIRAP